MYGCFFGRLVGCCQTFSNCRDASLGMNVDCDYKVWGLLYVEESSIYSIGHVSTNQEQSKVFRYPETISKIIKYVTKL